MLGQPISREDINADVKMYVEIQEELLPLLDDTVSLEAKTYYQAKEISFLFKKSALTELFELNPTADALRVYHGSQPDGTPTLILVAAKLVDPESDVTGVINLIESNAKAGYQWPSSLKMTAENPEDFDIISDNE